MPVFGNLALITKILRGFEEEELDLIKKFPKNKEHEIEITAVLFIEGRVVIGFCFPQNL